MPFDTSESVLDYPRPPRLERTPRHLIVEFAGVVVADTRDAFRVLETTHPPVYYIPPGDVRLEYLSRSQSRQTLCEWKGVATYWDLAAGERRSRDVAWSYEKPTPSFAAIAGYLAFYAGRVDACFVDDERVTPQPGGFYGGWITSDIRGPFKG